MTSQNSIQSALDLQSIINTAMDGIISINESQQIILFNTAAEQIFGYLAVEVLGHPIDRLIPGRFHQHHQRQIEQFGQGVVQTRRMGAQRTVFARRKSGEEFPIEASISQTVGPGGRIYSAIVRDVTEAVRHRQQIQEQSQMLDQVSDAVSVIDVHGRITYWNRAAERLFGWTAKEAIGQHAVELLYRGDPALLQEIDHSTRETHAWSGELTKANRAGKLILVEHRRTELRNESEQVRGFLCLDINITDRRKRERAERRSQRLEAIGTLAGGIAHDLNNVLTPIMMGSKLLSTGRTLGNRQELLETILASAERGAALIQQLLAFAGGVRGDRHPVVMQDLITETRKLLEHTFTKSVRLDVCTEVNLPPVWGDTTELSQVLMNLCINARDAMPDGGQLTIEAAALHLNGTAQQLHPDAHPGPYVVLTVADTGCGIPAEMLDRIFDPFFTTKDFGKGTGLGLATVQGIVKSHGGFIMVYSEPGIGSKFAIYLPAVVTQAMAPSAIPAAGDGGGGGGRWILLVDDEQTILTTTAAALEAMGYRVVTAKEGAAAIARVTEHRHEFAAVLLDMMMPGMDGLQTLSVLQRIAPELPVIASSGLRTAQREQEAREQGACAFLPKPYSDEQLQSTLAAVLTTVSQ